MVFKLRFKEDKRYLTLHDIYPADSRQDSPIYWLIPEDVRDAHLRFEDWYTERGLMPPELEAVYCNITGEIILAVS